jgi:hypothetical protein
MHIIPKRGTIKMKKLTETQTAEFYKIWYGLLSYVNKNKRICPEAQDDLDELNYQTNDVSLIHPIRNYLWEHPTTVLEVCLITYVLIQVSE